MERLERIIAHTYNALGRNDYNRGRGKRSSNLDYLRGRAAAAYVAHAARAKGPQASLWK